MRYTSTRSPQNIESAQAIAQGLATDGGLFVPQEFPHLSQNELKELAKLNYKERAKKVLALFLTDYTSDELSRCVEGAYTGSFDNEEPAPLVEIAPGVNLLELWHGPTCAFKDMALQLLPYLLTTAVRKTATERTVVILVATSGDTGKAALDGFADVPGTKIIVFYPRDGVSAMQKLQMTTQSGTNVAVCAIEGNFDNAQTGVKQIFADADMAQYLAERNLEFSSANSINFGRLVPQVVYYVSAYLDLLNSGRLKEGESFNVAVPTGNFGNILAAYYAKAMGIPIAKFICASNRNNILTDFLNSGVYDRNREFFTTDSPSMDILISSNLERLLYHLYQGNSSEVTRLMSELQKDGRYTISSEVLAELKRDFFGGFCDDKQTAQTIKELFNKYHYLCDTHTAVAANVYEQYVKATGDNRPCVIASTASPYKFANAVLPALTSDNLPDNEFAMVDLLAKLSDTQVPASLAELSTQEVKHSSCVPKEEMAKFIREFLK